MAAKAVMVADALAALHTEKTAKIEAQAEVTGLQDRVATTQVSPRGITHKPHAIEI